MGDWPQISQDTRLLGWPVNACCRNPFRDISFCSTFVGSLGVQYQQRHPVAYIVTVQLEFLGERVI